MKKNIGLLVFDLDGTLINSLDDLAQSLNFTLKTMGMPIRDINQVRQAIGDGVKMLLTRSMPAEDLHRLEEAYEIFHDHYKEHCHDSTYVYDGVLDLLKEYSDTPKAVLTNKSYEPTLDILKHLGIMDYFDVVVGGDSFETRKPDPVGLHYIIDKVGCKPEDAIMIGDGVPDVLVTKNTGVISIAILDGITDKERLLAQDPDYTVDSFGELSALLKGFSV